MPVDETAAIREQSEHRRRVADAALQNLEFIGSSRKLPHIGEQDMGSAQEEPLPLSTTAPSPSLRDPSAHRTTSLRTDPLTPPPAPSLGQFYGADAAFEDTAEVPVEIPRVDPVQVSRATEVVDYAELRSGVDRDQLDSNRPATPPPVLSTRKPAYEDVTDKNLNKPAVGKFSDSLITSEDYDI